MADTLKDFTVTCPDCQEEFEAGIPESALLPDAESHSIECPECGTESEIVYDATTQTVTLEDGGFEDDESGLDDEPELEDSEGED
jgi:endogenous inhibitor of DNA gyrase (YacG/DUF329 family)